MLGKEKSSGRGLCDRIRQKNHIILSEVRTSEGLMHSLDSSVSKLVWTETYGLDLSYLRPYELCFLSPTVPTYVGDDCFSLGRYAITVLHKINYHDA